MLWRRSTEQRADPVEQLLHHHAPGLHIDRSPSAGDGAPSISSGKRSPVRSWPYLFVQLAREVPAALGLLDLHHEAPG